MSTKKILLGGMLFSGAALYAMGQEHKHAVDEALAERKTAGGVRRTQQAVGVLGLLSEKNRSFLESNHTRQDLEHAAQLMQNCMHDTYKALIVHDMQHPRQSGDTQSLVSENGEQRQHLEQEYMRVLLLTLGKHHRQEFMRWQPTTKCEKNMTPCLRRMATGGVALMMLGVLAVIVAPCQ